MKTFHVYILTNKTKTVLYTGYTNDLSRRLIEHQSSESKFTHKYNVFYCIYYEEYQEFEEAHAREHQIKRWSRKKKDWLITRFNPERLFLNEMVHSPLNHSVKVESLNFEYVSLV